MGEDVYLNGLEWREIVRESVRDRPTLVWRKRLRHVLDLLDLAPETAGLDLFVQGDRRISFAGFRQSIEAAAAELARRGIRRDDHILISLYNAPEVLLIQWAAWRLGAIPVFGNRWWTETELAEVAERVEPALIATDMPTRDGRPIIGPAEIEGWWNLSIAEGPPDPRDHGDEDDLAIIVFTAGSTGVPKGVQLSHRNLIWTQQTFHIMQGGRPPSPRTPSEQKVTLMTTPMFHNGAIVTGLAALMDGNRMVMLRGKFQSDEVMRLIEQERVTAWQAVPTMYSRVLKHPDFERYDLSSLVAPSSGGMVVQPHLIADIASKLPHAAANFAVGYGMTENAFLTIATMAQLRERPGTVGKPIPTAELRIDSPDSQGNGEICGRTGALMIGYFGVENQPIDAEGWYHSGDLGRIDEDGYLYITGRLKDMVIRGGENISCTHVEAALMEHPDLLEAAVAGYPDEELGESLAAFVRAKPGSSLNEADLVAFARSRLAYFSVPSRWVMLEEPLPVVATGKVDKVSLVRTLIDGSGSA